MSLDEHSSVSSNFLVYSGGGDSNGGGGFVMLIHQQSSHGGGGAVKASVYECDHHHYQIQGTSRNNWIPTAVPTLVPARSNNMPVCHGAQTFTVWNDT
ncbi:hypothetical protein LOK49_LG04G00413 [Camellia lanceoleosa]|uniref:Uncharacterized protein n=1 Tax=Camellia lanceoleosa TaxID=1840588 RepID=A0ACC0HZ98_9ERIC|nr:hypothetical protein LOK49_LG04G00413 [Camellia lanceoleosa]